MTQQLVVVDPLWFDATSDPVERKPTLSPSRLARRSDHLRRIASACAEVVRSGPPTKLDAIWETLANDGRFDTRAPSVRDDELRILPTLGAFVVDESIASALRHDELLGLHVVSESSFVPAGPFADEPVSDAAWHIRAVRGRDRVDDGGEGVVVGVLDTGIDATHSEFASVGVSFSAFSEDGSTTTTQPRDFSIHGTHVAGIIAGATCGIAPKASLAVAAVLAPKGSVCAFASGLDWLLSGSFGRPGNRRGVDVINASVGMVGDDSRLRMLVRRALRENGTLTVAASGNDGASGAERCSAPARFPETLAVGAVDSRGMVASFSAYGRYSSGIRKTSAKPELSAPGVGIRSSVPGGRFRDLSATSMASPVVAGAAAVILSRRPELRDRPQALRAAILASATAPSSANPRYGNTGGIGSIRV